MQLKQFAAKHGRIPVKQEMYGLYRTARALFGTWNKAIEAAGLHPNPVRFAEKYVANDVHRCDSLAEKIIDDWLSKREIVHERSMRYPENPKLTADFVTKHHWIEFFGLMGELANYDMLVRRKKRLAAKYHLPLVAIYPKDLFPKNRLSEILN